MRKLSNLSNNSTKSHEGNQKFGLGSIYRIKDQRYAIISIDATHSGRYSHSQLKNVADKNGVKFINRNDWNFIQSIINPPPNLSSKRSLIVKGMILSRLHFPKQTSRPPKGLGAPGTLQTSVYSLHRKTKSSPIQKQPFLSRFKQSQLQQASETVAHLMATSRITYVPPCFAAQLLIDGSSAYKFVSTGSQLTVTDNDMARL